MLFLWPPKIRWNVSVRFAGDARGNRAVEPRRAHLVRPGQKTFVMYAEHHHKDRLAFWCAAPVGAQAEMVSAEPERFFVPPYVGVRGWLGVRLDISTDWDEIAEIVTEAYRHVAPRQLVTALDAQTEPAGNV